MWQSGVQRALVQFIKFLNKCICTNYRSVTFNAHISCGLLSSSYGRLRWSDQEVSELTLSLWEWSCPVHSADKQKNHCWVHAECLCIWWFSSFTKCSNLIDICKWCHTWVSNSWSPASPFRAKLSTSMSIIETSSLRII